MASFVNPGDPMERPRRLGHCPTLIDEVLCGAVVSQQPGRTSVSCVWCGAEWPPERWIDLASAQDQTKNMLPRDQHEGAA